MTEEHRQKIIAAASKPKSKETKERMSQARRAYFAKTPMSKETREKLSALRKGKPSLFAGHTHSDETKAQMRETRRLEKEYRLSLESDSCRSSTLGVL
jgi:NUMOD3 motif